MRYFIEVAYRGTNFSGFQIQDNAVTIQSELEKAMAVLRKEKIELTGSSRTDAGVHALQNFFHFDSEKIFSPRELYSINAILPPDIVVKNIYPVKDDAHCRFDATARAYKYYIHNAKNPFLQDRSYYYPYRLDGQLLQEAASLVQGKHDFTSFSKRNTQVKTFICNIEISEWERTMDGWMYHVKGNRFLRGMVRGLVATMLKVGRRYISMADFRQILSAKDCTRADFSAPGKGLFLTSVQYPEGQF